MLFRSEKACGRRDPLGPGLHLVGILAAAVMWAVLSRGEGAILIETSVPREIIIILQSILILTVVIAFQVAKRRIARLQMRRAGMQDQDFDDADAEEAA